MRLHSATLYALNIPFSRSIAHSAKVRTSCDSVIVRVESESGAVGYGEGTPRPYVSGETVTSVLTTLGSELWPAAYSNSSAIVGSNSSDLLQAVNDILIEGSLDDGVIANNAARAALEVALLDCALRERSQSFGDLLPPCRESVTYSGIIPEGSLDASIELARLQRGLGLNRIKIKVGSNQDVELVRAMRSAFGADSTLYVDSNCAWNVDEATERIEQLVPFGIAHVEQPMPRGPVEELARLRAAVSLPIMVDESLVTLDDARALIEAEACDIFNIRISKCGGIYRSLALAQMATDAGLSYQMGAHIGETSILAAAGRHLAFHLPTPLFIEGSVGTLLLEADVCESPLVFGPAGRAPSIDGDGLGIRVLDEHLERYAQHTIQLGARTP